MPDLLCHHQQREGLPAHMAQVRWRGSFIEMCSLIRDDISTFHFSTSQVLWWLTYLGVVSLACHMQLSIHVSIDVCMQVALPPMVNMVKQMEGQHVIVFLLASKCPRISYWDPNTMLHQDLPSPPIKTWHICMSPMPKDLAKKRKKNQGILVWRKWSITWRHSSSAILWLHS